MKFVTLAVLLGVANGSSLHHRSLRSSSLFRLKEKSYTMLKLHPYYHSTQGIHDELVRLSQNCPGMKLETRSSTGDDGSSRDIDVVTIRNTNGTAVNRNFILFGEHARELISPESGLHFVKTLCGETSLTEKAKSVLQDNDFMIVVNGNPASRQKVEQGDFCLRVNPNGVDLNRNWDEKWEATAELDAVDTNPGPKAFSEPETKIFHDLVNDYKPTNFLTIHSGTKGMYMPWAYDMSHLAQRNQPLMMDILKKLDRDHCECPFGAAGKEVGYPCPGTCLDWVYDQGKCDYSFAFEIYTDPSSNDMLKERWQEKMQGDTSFLQEQSHLGHEYFKDLFTEHPSSFVQLQSHSHRRGNGMTADQCFAQFNPDSEELFNSVVENWSGAYLDLAGYVAYNIQHGITTNSANTTDGSF